MIKKVLILICGFIFLFANVYAQFPYFASYRQSTALNTIFGGSSQAFLTAGKGPIPGPGGTTVSDTEGNGYLRLTNNNTFQKGYIYNETSFPSTNGLKIEFEYFTYGGSGADGISFFLFDATASPFTIGSFGGSLGYSQISIPEGETPGVSKGYLGIGIDEYGNFSSSTEGRQGGFNELKPGSITLRGKGNGMNFFDPENYKYLTSSQTKAEFGFDLIPSTNQRATGPNDPNYRKVALDLKPIIGGGYMLSVKITVGGSTPTTTTVIDEYPYTVPAPANLKYGLAASTGASTNFHEIRNIFVDEYYPSKPIAADLVASTCNGQPIAIDVAAKAEPKVIVAPGKIDLNPAVPGLQQTLTIAGKGTFNANSSGIVTFTPLNASVSGDIVIPYTIESTSEIASNPATLKVSVFSNVPANAGQDQVLNINSNTTTAIQLNGNPLVSGLTGLWVQTAGPPVTISNPTTSNATVLAAGPGIYKFQWTVTASGSCQAIDDVNIVINEIPVPKIGLTKVLSESKVNSNGSYDVKFLFTVSNYGKTKLNKVSLVDDLAAVFDGTTFSVISKSIVSPGSLIINNAYNGKSSKELLDPSSSLEIGASAQVALVINILPVPKEGTFLNTATAGGNSAFNGELTTKISTNSLTPGPDLIPSETPVELSVPKPKIGLTKVLKTAVRNLNGSFNVSYAFTLTNYGGVKLKNVSLIEDLEAVFQGTPFTVVAKSIKSNTNLIINNAFDGLSNKDLLSGLSTLDIAASGIVELEINVIPAKSGTFLNTATAYGTSIINQEQTSKISSNSLTPNSDLPPSPTPVTLDIPQPKIGVVKWLANVAPAQNGSYDAEFKFTVSNFGEVNLNKVSLIDDIETAFKGCQVKIIALEKVGSSNLKVNTSFNGFSNKEMLDNTSTLVIGEHGTISLKLNLLPTDKEGTFLNEAIAKGYSVFNNDPVTQKSTNSMVPGADLTPSPTPVDLNKKKIFIPNGFSPNNDGVNDKFVVKYSGTGKINLQIFNRWANLIYKNPNYDNSWDGRCTEGVYFGTDVPAGTYYYIITLENKERYAGYITINR